MSGRKPAAAPPAEPAPVDLMARAIETGEILARINTPEAVEAIAELAEAGFRLAVAFDRASSVVLAAIPTPPTNH